MATHIGRSWDSARLQPLRPWLPPSKETHGQERTRHIPLTILLGLSGSLDDRERALHEGALIKRRIAPLQRGKTKRVCPLDGHLSEQVGGEELPNCVRQLLKVAQVPKAVRAAE